MSLTSRRDLINVTAWGHDLLAEVLEDGDLAVDLTAGNGHDTLALSRMTGTAGQVVACDIQARALTATAERLQQAGIAWRLHPDIDTLPIRAGVDLIRMDHAHIAAVLPRTPRGIVANLGYLPGGDQTLVTRPETTLPALRACCELLERGGRMAVVVYPCHAGGAAEAAALNKFFAGLDPSRFQILQMGISNRPQAPFLIMTEKR
jgi:23S rRNA U2552 (ribose-2'-O)-methylase RlmE/FtsJ